MQRLSGGLAGDMLGQWPPPAVLACPQQCQGTAAMAAPAIPVCHRAAVLSCHHMVTLVSS